MCIYGPEQRHLTNMGRSRIKLVPEQGLPAEIEQVFAASRQAFGLAFVPELLRAYATIPKFLEAMWAAVAPAVRTREFATCSDRLRAQAYTEAFNYLGVPDALDTLSSEIAETIELFHQVAPRFLLLTFTILRAMESPVGSDAVREESSLPKLSQVVLTNDASWSATARDIIDDYRLSRGIPMVNCWMRALARYPEFLDRYWKITKPQIASPIYQRIAFELRETAFSFPDHLLIRVDLTPERLAESVLSPSEIAEAGRITNLFASEYAAMLVDVELGRIATERAPSEPSVKAA